MDFYEDLKSVMISIPNADKILLLGYSIAVLDAIMKLGGGH